MQELLQLFDASLLISLLSFGGGGSAIALFYQFGVTETGWMSGTDLATVLAFGFATPGPAIFGAATFMGYHVHGLQGAVVGTIGIFVAPWLLAAGAAKYTGSWIKHPGAQHFTKGVALAASGVVCATALSLLPHQLNKHVWLLAITAGAFIAIVRWKWNPLYVLALGGAIGIFL